MVSVEIISVIVFVVLIGGLLLRDRKNLIFNYGIIIRRWTKGLQWIDKLVKKYHRQIKIIGNIGVIAGLIAGIGGTVVTVILTLKLQQTFSPVLPTVGGYQIPGPVFSVPFWYWLLAIFIIVVTHESMHAVFVRLEKVRVKNYGLLMLLLLPIGAFVDPDNNQIKRLSLMKKLRIFAAGSFANFVVALIAFIFFISSATAFNTIADANIRIESVTENSPATESGLEGDILQKINNQTIKSNSDIGRALNNTKPGDEILITTEKGEFKITLGEHPEVENKSYIGVGLRQEFDYNIFGFNGALPPVVLRIILTVISFLQWLLLISAGVGIVNMLPIKPLDGGLFFGEIFTKLFKNKGNYLINALSIILLGILLFNIFGLPLLRNIIG